MLASAISSSVGESERTRTLSISRSSGRYCSTKGGAPERARAPPRACPRRPAARSRTGLKPRAGCANGWCRCACGRRCWAGAVLRERRPRALGKREGQPSDAARQCDTQPQRTRGRRQAVLRDEPQERREIGPAQGMEHAMPAGSRHVRLVRSARVGAAAPYGRAAAQLCDEGAPLQSQQERDAERVKQGARPALPES
jgi:hypothetical protein